MVETWLYHYDPETKQQSMGWRHRGTIRPKIIRMQNFGGEILASILWDENSIHLIDFLPKGQPINAGCYSFLLV
jgi:hypothetical protein